MYPVQSVTYLPGCTLGLRSELEEDHVFNTGHVCLACAKEVAIPILMDESPSELASDL